MSVTVETEAEESLSLALSVAPIVHLQFTLPAESAAIVTAEASAKLVVEASAEP